MFSNYRVDVERIEQTTSWNGDVWKVGDMIRFVRRVRQDDTSLHYIVEMGRDSDNDVWIKLETGEQFFDWPDICEVIVAAIDNVPDN